ncbi:MAG: hypothetical protein ACLQDV_24390 [Candidatus Binataceae bacterium]
MPDLTPITSSFPVARCDQCDKSVLTCVLFADDGSEFRACAHCDSPITREISWVSATELESTGYEIGARPAKKTGGCGCSSGGGCSIRKN